MLSKDCHRKFSLWALMSYEKVNKYYTFNYESTHLQSLASKIAGVEAISPESRHPFTRGMNHVGASHVTSATTTPTPNLVGRGVVTPHNYTHPPCVSNGTVKQQHPEPHLWTNERPYSVRRYEHEMKLLYLYLYCARRTWTPTDNTRI